MSAYAPFVSLRSLFALLVALTVLFAPALARAGEAVAAVPDQQLQRMESGHCKSAASQSGHGMSKHGKAGTANCCVAMCMAVAVASPASPQALVQHGSSATFPVAYQYHGCISEIATPPPRLA